jgi:hypothetical protein
MHLVVYDTDSVRGESPIIRATNHLHVRTSKLHALIS